MQDRATETTWKLENRNANKCIEKVQHAQMNWFCSSSKREIKKEEQNWVMKNSLNFFSRLVTSSEVIFTPLLYSTYTDV